MQWQIIDLRVDIPGEERTERAVNNGVEKHRLVLPCYSRALFSFVALDLCRAYLDLALDRRIPIRASCKCVPKNNWPVSVALYTYRRYFSPPSPPPSPPPPPPPLERPHKLFVTSFTFTPRIARGIGRVQQKKQLCNYVRFFNL